MLRNLVFALILQAAVVPATWATETVDLGAMSRIRDEGLNRSRVMDHIFHLTDVIGPRLTGSPQLKEANEWTRRQFADWGLANARLEGFPFGRGWSFTSCEVRMTSPRTLPILALPKAWTPGTNGPVRGEVVQVELATEEDLEKQKGKLAGKIVLLDEPAEFDKLEDEQFQRRSREELEKLAEFEIDTEESRWRSGAVKRWKFRKTLNEFLEKEKVLAVVEVSSRINGIVRVGGGGSWEPGESVGVPSVVVTAEHYNQILRLLDKGKPVELEIDVAARFHDEDLKAYNTVAEIPGTDKKEEIVMAGAHLDSWHGATGATDNAAGSAVVMEAARILKALGVKPRRTIRFVLWTGEEQGLLGSIAYVKQHFADRPETTDPEQKALPERYREETWPLQLKAGHGKLAAYFNLDNGSGKIRGIYAETNAAVKPIFEAWLAPFHDLGATTVTLRATSGTDHVPLDRVGLPGFQFIQDTLDYHTRTHHTNLDTYDHIQTKDVIQASTIMAAFLYNAAMRDEPLPRKPLPQAPPEKKDSKDKKETAP
ncbi:MAG TPA: M20/M25/M40 family metallo-hydrolase [Thermoanaerobaculia bacterium]|nr:M20/M25/M40 family metallo-hydrolase [Thermoanaerobaculia bacterium]